MQPIFGKFGILACMIFETFQFSAALLTIQARRLPHICGQAFRVGIRGSLGTREGYRAKLFLGGVPNSFTQAL